MSPITAGTSTYFLGVFTEPLNHLYLVDRLWFARFTGESYQPSGLDEEVEPDRDQLLERIDQQARRWVEFATGVSGDSLSGTLNYRNTQGRKRSVNRAGALQHVFNHGTHHRGQVSAGLTGLGREAPEMDLFYYLLEEA